MPINLVDLEVEPRLLNRKHYDINDVNRTLKQYTDLRHYAVCALIEDSWRDKDGNMMADNLEFKSKEYVQATLLSAIGKGMATTPDVLVNALDFDGNVVHYSPYQNGIKVEDPIGPVEWIEDSPIETKAMLLEVKVSFNPIKAWEGALVQHDGLCIPIVFTPNGELHPPCQGKLPIGVLRLVQDYLLRTFRKLTAADVVVLRSFSTTETVIDICPTSKYLDGPITVDYDRESAVALLDLCIMSIKIPRFLEPSMLYAKNSEGTIISDKMVHPKAHLGKFNLLGLEGLPCNSTSWAVIKEVASIMRSSVNGPCKHFSRRCDSCITTDNECMNTIVELSKADAPIIGHKRISEECSKDVKKVFGIGAKKRAVKKGKLSTAEIKKDGEMENRGVKDYEKLSFHEHRHKLKLRSPPDLDPLIEVLKSKSRFCERLELGENCYNDLDKIVLDECRVICDIVENTELASLWNILQQMDKGYSDFINNNNSISAFTLNRRTDLGLFCMGLIVSGPASTRKLAAKAPVLVVQFLTGKNVALHHDLYGTALFKTKYDNLFVSLIKSSWDHLAPNYWAGSKTLFVQCMSTAINYGLLFNVTAEEAVKRPLVKEHMLNVAALATIGGINADMQLEGFNGNARRVVTHITCWARGGMVWFENGAVGPTKEYEGTVENNPVSLYMASMINRMADLYYDKHKIKEKVAKIEKLLAPMILQCQADGIGFDQTHFNKLLDDVTLINFNFEFQEMDTD